MTRPKDVLSAEDYSNYRNVRSVAVLFVVLGSILFLGGLGGALGGDDPTRKEQIPVAAAIAMAVVGFAGAVGGVAVLRGNRRWTVLIYGIAVIYLFGFPIGTILSYVMLKGLPRYLDSRERLKSSLAAAD